MNFDIAPNEFSELISSIYLGDVDEFTDTFEGKGNLSDTGVPDPFYSSSESETEVVYSSDFESDNDEELVTRHESVSPILCQTKPNSLGYSNCHY
jgi:hypothetical protein